MHIGGDHQIIQPLHETLEDEDAWETMLAGQIRFVLDVIDSTGAPVTATSPSTKVRRFPWPLARQFQPRPPSFDEKRGGLWAVALPVCGVTCSGPRAA